MRVNMNVTARFGRGGENRVFMRVFAAREPAAGSMISNCGVERRSNRAVRRIG